MTRARRFPPRARAALLAAGAAACFGGSDNMGSRFVAPLPPGTPVRLGFATEPRATLVNQPLSPAPRVAVLDASGVVVTDAVVNVRIELADGISPYLIGPRSVTTVGGIATFRDLAVTWPSGPRGYALRATASGLQPATSRAFLVQPGGPFATDAHMATYMPRAGMPFTVYAWVEDESGYHLEGAYEVTLALGQNPTGAILGGTLTRVTTGDVATFDDLMIGAPGTGYTIVAMVGGLQTGDTQAFTIYP